MALINRKILGGPLQPVVIAEARFTEDGELWTTVTERENDVFSVYQETGIAATKYIALIDLDNPLFPHLKDGQPTNRIDITSIYFALELSVSAGFSFQYGVISRMNATNADIWYFTSIPLLTGTSQEDKIVPLRAIPSQIKLDINGLDQLRHGITNVRETNVAAVNTGLALDSPAGAGSVTPGRGDVVVKVTRTGGTANFSTFMFYHTH